MTSEDQQHFSDLVREATDQPWFDPSAPVSILRNMDTSKGKKLAVTKSESPPKKWRIYSDELQILNYLPSQTASQRRYRTFLLMRVAACETWAARDALLMSALNNIASIQSGSI